ncbi:MAG TPA: leucyl/phenylalanyl-tRNA--protein transferase [Tepidisphaeraceae bacterium]|jgi:leucyl/phenylalanyl-tRNA--protein transferase
MRLDPETLLSAYAQGAFPMTDRDGRIRWYTANPRGVFPLDSFHVPQTLQQTIRQKIFEIRIDHDFEAVMRACMAQRREHTWIGEELIRAYVALHKLGYAYSVEAWRDGELAGGLYGVSLGAAFFGESMFHRQRDASKVALAALVERLNQRGYELLDAQTCTEHLRRFGCVEIDEKEYLKRLRKALQKECRFN